MQKRKFKGLQLSPLLQVAEILLDVNYVGGVLSTPGVSTRSVRGQKTALLQLILSFLIFKMRFHCRVSLELKNF